MDVKIWMTIPKLGLDLILEFTFDTNTNSIILIENNRDNEY